MLVKQNHTDEVLSVAWKNNFAEVSEVTSTDAVTYFYLASVRKTFTESHLENYRTLYDLGLWLLHFLSTKWESRSQTSTLNTKQFSDWCIYFSHVCTSKFLISQNLLDDITFDPSI